MSAEDWMKLAVFVVTGLGGGGGIAAAFRWILQPYKDALSKAEEQSKLQMLQVTNKQSVIDVLVQSHLECEIEHSDKDAWIASAHSWIVSATTWMKNHGAELPELGDAPPRRDRKAMNQVYYLQNQTAQNTANLMASQKVVSGSNPK